MRFSDLCGPSGGWLGSRGVAKVLFLLLHGTQTRQWQDKLFTIPAKQCSSVLTLTFGKKTGWSHWLLRLTWGLLVSWEAWNEKVSAWNWRTIAMGNPSASRESCTSEGWGFHEPFFQYGTAILEESMCFGIHCHFKLCATLCLGD